MAVWALLSISQTVKAADVTVYFQCPSGWTTPVHAYAYNSGADANKSSWSKASAGSEISTGTSLLKSVNNSVFTYTLAGSYNSNGNGMSNESTSFDFDGNDKYTYTFTATQTGTYCFRINTSYESRAALCPETNASKLTSTPTNVSYTDKYGKSNNYWTYEVTAGKKYTFTLLETKTGNNGYTRKLSVVPEEAVVTKEIKLFNGSSELTGSNGKYSLDLSSATSDATIKLTIDDVPYGLATAQAISTAGTTNVDFVANATAALTLAKGLIYSLSVTEDGKMTVVAKEMVNPVITTDAGYYLVGNFFSKYNIDGGDPEDEINYSRLYFKFNDNGIVDNVHTYSIDIPASISAYMQILGVDDNNVKVVYGPGEIKAVSAATLDTNKSLTGTSLQASNNLRKDENYWSLTTRNDVTHDDDGIYTISFTESNGVPTNWTITHNAFKRVSYLISCAEGASAQPLYNKRGTDELTSSFTNETKEFVHFDGNSQCYVIGNVLYGADDEYIKRANEIDNTVHKIKNIHDITPTYSKLFLLGNGGYEYSDQQDHNKLTANEDPIKFSLKGTYFVRVNPSQGNRKIAMNKTEHYAFCYEIYTGTGTPAYPDAISMVGPAIASTTTTVGDKTTWNWASTAGDMTYDENDRCYKLVLNTTDDMVGKTFRFVGDHAITQNWYENEITANTQYPTSQEGYSDATVADPNYVSYTNNCTVETIEHANDIRWNRGAGLWTVRFYIDKSKTGDNAVFYYTITGASKIYIPVTAHMGKLLRTYTSAIDVVPVNDDVQIFAAYSYEKGSKNETGYGDETGTVKLYRMKFIPANQGVVLFAPKSPVADGTKTKMEVVPAYSATVKRYSRDAYDYIEKWAESETKEDIWVFDHNYSEGQNKWNNYMIPVLKDTNVTQFYYDENNKWSGRVFSFTRLSQTDAGRGKIDADSEDDYYGFFRAAGKVKASYSYLMLPKTVMTSNGQILGQTQDGPNKKEDIKNFSKSMVWFEGIDAPMDNETTGISELKNNISNTDAAYYTLQGMKVVKPVKGIYIHQGKKVIVK